MIKTEKYRGTGKKDQKTGLYLKGGKYIENRYYR
jgi:hypothetical protein